VEEEHGYRSTGAVVGQVPLDFFGPQVPAGMTVGAGLLGALPFHAWNVAALAPNTRRTVFWWSKLRHSGP